MENLIKDIDIKNITESNIINLKSAKTKKKFDWVEKKIKQHAKIEDKKLLAKYIFCYLVWNEEKDISSLSEKGILLIYKYNIKSDVEILLRVIEQTCVILKYSSSEIDFIKQKINLLWLFDYYKKETTELTKDIRKYERNKEEDEKYYSTFRYDVLIYLNTLYFDRNFEDDSEMKILNHCLNYTTKFDSESLSLEELAEGCSYLYSLFDKLTVKKINKQMIFSRKNVISKALEDMVNRASHLRRVQEWEARHDFLKLELKKEKNTYLINDDISKIERQLVLSTISNMTSQYVYINNEKTFSSTITLEKVVDKLIKEKTFHTVTNGIFTRNVFKLDLFQVVSDYISEHGYAELNTEFSYFCKEWNIDETELNTLQISENVNVYEVIKFKILFQLVAQIVLSEYKKGSITKELILGMDFFVTKKEKLVNLISIFYENNLKKAEEILNLMLVNDETNHLDLIYTPFVEANGQIYCLSSVICHSNIVRNIIQHSYTVNNKFVTKRNGHDTLSRKCREVFEENTHFEAKDSLKMKYKKNDIEIDTIAYNADTIICIECKNPLLATSSYEMRSTLQLRAKGGDQLKKLERAFDNEQWKINFFSDNNIPFNNQKIIYLIVFGNRLLSNSYHKKYPVRGINEVDMILNRGKVDLYYLDEKESISIWANSEFEVEDLLKYLSEDNSIVNCKINAMEKRFFTETDLKGRNLQYQTYIMNQKKMLENIISYTKQ